MKYIRQSQQLCRAPFANGTSIIPSFEYSIVRDGCWYRREVIGIMIHISEGIETRPQPLTNCHAMWAHQSFREAVQPLFVIFNAAYSTHRL